MSTDPAETVDTVVKSYLTPAKKKGIAQEIQNLFDDLYQDMEMYAADFIVGVAAERTKAFLNQVLQGDENAAAKLFEIGESSRYVGFGYDAGKPWAKLIHNKLFTLSAVELRRKLVEAHADLLSNERIKDLEAIVEGLTLQIKNLNAKKGREY